MKDSIERMINDFDPGKYADGRRKRIMDILEAKAKEKGTVQAPAVEEEEGEGPADLVAALEESMRKVRAGS
jgi:DNA end-binding protein Ku